MKWYQPVLGNRVAALSEEILGMVCKAEVKYAHA